MVDHPTDLRIDPDPLTVGFRAGDPAALRALVAEVGGAALAVARRVTGTRALAEEAVQQGLLQAWQARMQLDDQRDVRPWLFTIVRRAAIDAVRRDRPEARVDLAAIDHHVAADDDPARMVTTTWAVRRAVDALPADERDVVRLQHFEGCTHQEIASRLGVPVGTVKSRSHRAHGRLVAALREREGA